MAKVIKGSEIVEKGWSKEAVKDANLLKKALDSIDKSIVKLASDMKKTTQGNLGKSVKDVQQLEQAVKKTTAARKSAIQIEKEQKKIADALSITEQKRIANNRADAKLVRDKANAEVRFARAAKGSLEAMRAELAVLKLRHKELVTGSKKELAYRNRIMKTTNALKAQEASIGVHTRNVGNYGSAVSRVGGILKGFGATLLATFSFRMIGSFFKSSIDGFRTQEKAVKKVEQAINSTGGAAGRTSEELQKMASELQKNSLFGDEQILNEVTAQLLTFTNIGGEQFDRTQQVALDLATVLDGDLKSASIQLGKALNDPIANLSALSRSGIQFSKEQKALIKSLAETGRLAEAQAVILDELERQYGGQAKAAAEADGGIQQLKNTFGDLQEIIGGELVKAIKPIADDMREWIENLDPEEVKAFANGVASLIKEFANGVKGIFEFGVALSTFTDKWSVAFNSVENFQDALENTTDILERMIPGMSMFRRIVDEVADALGIQVEETKKLTAEQRHNTAVREKSIEVTRELLKANEDEMSDIPILIDALQNENTTREDKQAIIEKLQKDYPDLIKNIDLETASTERLTQLKRELIKQLFEQAIAEKKAQVLGELTAQILDKRIKLLTTNTEAGKKFLNQQISDLEQGFKVIETIDQELRANLGSFVEGLDLESPINATGEAISKLKIEIAELEKAIQTADGEELKSLQEKLDKKRAELARYTGDYEALILDGLDAEKEANDESVKDLKKTLKEKRDLLDQSEIEEQLRFEQSQQRREDLEKQLEENSKILEENEQRRLEAVEKFNEDQEKIAEQRLENEKKAEEERIARLKKFKEDTLAIFKDITDGLAQNIDERIALRKEEISASQNEISRLQELAKQGDANAAEAIKAEQVRIAKEKIEIEQLQKKKRDLLLTVSALERVNQLIGEGNTTPFKTAQKDFEDFFNNLPTFFEGTEGTLAESLGRTGTKDGHLVRAHDNEFIVGSKDSSALQRAGFTKTKDIVSAAMTAQNLGLTGRAIKKGLTSGSDTLSAHSLNRLETTIKEGFNNMQVTNIDPQKLFAVISKGGNVKNITHKKGFRFS